MANIQRTSNDAYFQAIFQHYQDRIPDITVNNFKEIGDLIMERPNMKNEFINTLFNKIGLTLLQNKKYTSRLDIFSKGKLEYGETIEQIMCDLIECKDFTEQKDNNEVSELVSAQLPNIKALYHSENYKHKYKVTISDIRLRKAFNDKYGVDKLVASIITSVQNSIAYDRECMLKSILSASVYKNTIPVAYDNGSTGSRAKNLVTEIKKNIIRLETMSKNYNNADINTFTRKEDLVLVIGGEYATDIDINLLATAFNLDKAQISTRIIVVDELPTLDDGSSETKPICVLMDKDYIVDYTTLYEVRQFENANTLTTNLFYHVWGIMCQNDFTNAIQFVEA